MNRQVRERRQARREIGELVAFIRRDSTDAALRFLDALEETYDGLRMFPLSGREWDPDHPGLRGIRKVAIRGFPNHLIFYRIADDGSIEIVRVLHGARDLDAALDETEPP